MTSLTVYSEAADGEITGQSTSYATARSTSASADTTDSLAYVGQNRDASYRYVRRVYLSFDTSAIPDTATVSSATLYLTSYYDSSGTDFNILVYRYAWTEALGGANMETNYDGAYGSGTLEGTFRNTASGWVHDVEYNMAMDPTGINLTGDTKYALVSSRDVGSVEPDSLGEERVQLCTSERGTIYRPRLVIEYSLIASDTQTLLWGVAGVGSDTQTLLWNTNQVASDAQGLLWNQLGIVSDTQTLLWNMAGAVGKSQTLLWNMDALVIPGAQTLVWNFLSVFASRITLVWDSGGVQHAVRAFRWGLGCALPDGRALCLPDTVYELEVLEVK